MKLILTILCVLMIHDSVEAAQKDFTHVKCPSVETIARAYLDAETSGFRVGSSCLAPERLPFLSLGGPPDSDGSVSKPLQIAPDKNPYHIDRVVKINASYYKVIFHDRVRKGQATEPLADEIEFETLSGPMKNRLGCALLARPPQHLVVRASCAKP